VEEKEIKPFVCLDVTGKSSLNSISKRIDVLFPKTIVRLKIDGNYSPFFYTGKGKWIYKPKPKKKVERFTFKIFVDDTANDFLEKDQILMLEHLNISSSNLKLAGEIYLINKELPGLFFTDGENIVIDQSLIEDAQLLSKFFIEQFDCKIVLDLFNEANSGIIVLRTKKDIFGIRNND